MTIGPATAVPIVRSLVIAAPRVLRLATVTKIILREDALARHPAATDPVRMATKVVVVGDPMAHPAKKVHLGIEIWRTAVAAVGERMFLRVEIDLREIAMKDAAIGDPMGHQVMAMAHLLMVKRCDDTEDRPMVRRGPMTLLAAMAHGTHMATTLMDRRIHPARMLPNPVRPTTSQIAKPRRLFESLVSTRSRVSGPSQPGTGLLL